MERAELRDRAKELGLDLPKNISDKKLKEAVEFKESSLNSDESSINSVTSGKVPSNSFAVPDRDKPITNRKEANLLIRAVITPLSTSTKVDSEWVSASSGKIGTIKQAVMFNKEILVPRIILEQLKEKNIVISQSKKVNGKDVKCTVIGKAYSIQELPNLTDKELRQKGIIK